MTAPQGFLLLDKPPGWSSHRVVSRVRKWLGLRKVGHAGTLDPMATGLLVMGIGPGTRLLTFAVGLDKTYTATVRLGASTPTDDADSAPDRFAEPERLVEITEDAIDEALTGLRGDILQAPSAVSAIKVDGRRAYARVRAGEDVELDPRPVTVSRFDRVSGLRPGIHRTEAGSDHPVIDLDVIVDCSSGTYIRALARDLGAALGAHGHLTALRRTRVGDFSLAEALPVPAFDAEAPLPDLLPLPSAAARLVPTITVSPEEGSALRQGRFLQNHPLQNHPLQNHHLDGAGPEGAGAGPFAAVVAGPVDDLIAIVDPEDGALRPRVVFSA